MDITLPINKQGNVNCYFLDDPQFSYFESPQFSGNLSKGGSVNCERINFYPHASGTHTECALHVAPVNFDMRHVQVSPLQLAQLISIQPEKVGEDRVVSKAQLSSIQKHSACVALVIRTLPNDPGKLHRNYSDTNPPYFEPEVLSYLREMGFQHLLTDLPSIDKESDEGRLSAHKNWFIENGVSLPNRTITELIYVPEQIQDGLYALAMNIPSLETDAVPSRIVLYPCD